MPAQRISVIVRISEDLLGEIKRLRTITSSVCESALKEADRRSKLEGERKRRKEDPCLSLVCKSEQVSPSRTKFFHDTHL